jgi:hypothetical protein
MQTKPFCFFKGVIILPNLRPNGKAEGLRSGKINAILFRG